MFKIFPNEKSLAKQLSYELYTAIEQNPKITLGLATGSTMLPVYSEFIELFRTNPLDLAQTVTFNLDEYIGLSAEHPQSYNYFMHENLFKYLPSLEHSHTHLPHGICTDAETECREYSDKIITNGGIDIQLLGIGSNGHIGFNEPNTPFDSKTHIVDLTEKTRIDNGRFFDDMSEVPTQAITMGLGEIYSAKKVYLVITGEHKADIVNRLYSSEITPSLPASILKKHPNTSIYIDQSAASLLPSQIQMQYQVTI